MKADNVSPMNYHNVEHPSNAAQSVEYMVEQHVCICSTKNLNSKNMFTISITSHRLVDNLYFLNFNQTEEYLYYYLYYVYTYDADILRTELRSCLSEYLVDGYLVDGYNHMYALKSEHLYPIWRSAVRKHNVNLQKPKKNGRIRCGS